MRLIQSLASKELVRNLHKLKFDQHFCDACKIEKQAHASHKAKNIVSTTRCLELLHMDLVGPSAIWSYGGNSYTLVIVDDYSRLLNPLTSLTKRNQKYEWGKKEEEAFQTLKNDLCDTPIKRMYGDALSLEKNERVKSRRVYEQQMEKKGDESLYFMNRIWVLLVGSVLDEAHASRYLVHPGADKTYYNLGDMYCYFLVRVEMGEWGGVFGDERRMANGGMKVFIGVYDILVSSVAGGFSGSHW
ncbi:hypothetical protein Tco_1006424 [Tanacetum coccineum]|uniref:Uncharacterized protein n=1 Tax=Tanacetum coccineum TaxID=301880 RepID=A0ABQ5FHU3_9ASTR